METLVAGTIGLLRYPGVLKKWLPPDQAQYSTDERPVAPGGGTINYK